MKSVLLCFFSNFIEVRMLESSLGGDSFGGVKGDQLAQQVETQLVEVVELLFEDLRPEFREGGFEVSQLCDTRPLVVTGRPEELENAEDLSDFGVTSEKGFFLHNFTEDAANGPHVYSQRVVFSAQEYFWRTIPQSFYFMSEGTDGDSEGSGEAEISYLDGTQFVDKQILGFEVPVDDTTGVTVVDPIQDLIHITLDLQLGQAVLV